MYRRMRRELEEHNRKRAQLPESSHQDWLVGLNYEENEAEDDIPFPPAVFAIATPTATYMVFTNLLQRLNTLMYGYKGDPAGTQVAVDDDEEQLDWNDGEEVRAFANDELRASNWAADRDVAEMRKINKFMGY
ncbi:hypothetical protein Pmar_PMAR008504 [Perkinsus marinus ATCC 50983]|uniref:Uncharacterized protein n=1 Tax=Perkinsus marinus (strain ATCC 50983 / TXsc) TaxID=423536 RepID=C5L0H8_PERM5|nr:hypothetical protein Pmar_PMAR008504 [Perkinsus marinus ATCC 50983]EER09767.1 hypothetical protein Pmar_PMAR008504 [Perkinsus marinus ATCC 50983]|eukprot:XP_002777972.1 hypothetical protein Pmar_PMAR008504 [Perkinsus marinus ATCC 50983]